MCGCPITKIQQLQQLQFNLDVRIEAPKCWACINHVIVSFIWITNFRRWWRCVCSTSGTMSFLCSIFMTRVWFWVKCSVVMCWRRTDKRSKEESKSRRTLVVHANVNNFMAFFYTKQSIVSESHHIAHTQQTYRSTFWLFVGLNRRRSSKPIAV